LPPPIARNTRGAKCRRAVHQALCVTALRLRRSLVDLIEQREHQRHRFLVARRDDGADRRSCATAGDVDLAKTHRTVVELLLWLHPMLLDPDAELVFIEIREEARSPPEAAS